MPHKIPLFKIYSDPEDIKRIVKVIGSKMHWAEGSCIEDFEYKIARYVGRKYSIVFNSGTSAMHAILLAHGIKDGDEVIVPSFTFIATANAPLFVGAKPVFADIEEQTLGLDPDDLEVKITKKTKAIIAVHYGGCPCKIREIRKIAEKHRLILIEDAAEALGAKIGNKKAGTFGDAAMFSFCQNKIITTGEGGAVVTDSKNIRDRMKLIRSHGKSNTAGHFPSIGHLDHIALGYNFRMPSFTAALGIAQLGKADKLIEMRRKNAKYLTGRLKQEIDNIIINQPPKDCYHVCQMYNIRVNNRDKLIRYLANKGIATKVYFQPVHLTHFYKNKLGYKCRLPVTEKIAKQVLALPMYPALSKKEMDYIVKNIKGFLRR